MKKQNPTTLLELLNSMKSFSVAFRDKSTKTGVIRIKGYNQLSAYDFGKMRKVAAQNPQILSIDNNWDWDGMPCFVIKMSTPPSKIILKK